MRLSGRVTASEIAAFAAELRASLARLRPPFDVLNDIRRLEAFDGLEPDQLKPMVEMLRQTGVRKVVRIVGRSKDGALLMSRLGRLIGTDGHLAYSPEEAEALLNAR